MSPTWFDPRRFLGFLSARADDFIKNEPVRANLRKQGDTGKLPRPIKHYAYFPTNKGQADYRDFIISRGYRIDLEDFGAGDDGRLVIIFSKLEVPNAIDKETALLDDHAARLGGEYDGWETEVIRNK